MRWRSAAMREPISAGRAQLSSPSDRTTSRRLARLCRPSGCSSAETGTWLDSRIRRLGTVRGAVAINHAHGCIVVDASASIGPDGVAGLDEDHSSRRAQWTTASPGRSACRSTERRGDRPRYCFRSASDWCFALETKGRDRTHSGHAWHDRFHHSGVVVPATPMPRLGHWRLLVAYARSDRLALRGRFGGGTRTASSITHCRILSKGQSAATAGLVALG
jgi:hypothetical protein